MPSRAPTGRRRTQVQSRFLFLNKLPNRHLCESTCLQPVALQATSELASGPGGCRWRALSGGNNSNQTEEPRRAGKSWKEPGAPRLRGAGGVARSLGRPWPPRRPRPRCPGRRRSSAGLGCAVLSPPAAAAPRGQAVGPADRPQRPSCSSSDCGAGASSFSPSTPQTFTLLSAESTALPGPGHPPHVRGRTSRPLTPPPAQGRLPDTPRCRPQASPLPALGAHLGTRAAAGPLVSQGPWGRGRPRPSGEKRHPCCAVPASHGTPHPLPSARPFPRSPSCSLLLGGPRDSSSPQSPPLGAGPTRLTVDASRGLVPPPPPTAVCALRPPGFSRTRKL